MARTAGAFTQSELTKALKAIRDAGHTVGSVEVRTLSGERLIVRVGGENAERAPSVHDDDGEVIDL